LVASHFGGTRNGMVMSWPGRIKDKGSVRQLCHVIDITPTIYEAANFTPPPSARRLTALARKLRRQKRVDVGSEECLNLNVSGSTLSNVSVLARAKRRQFMTARRECCGEHEPSFVEGALQIGAGRCRSLQTIYEDFERLRGKHDLHHTQYESVRQRVSEGTERDRRPRRQPFPERGRENAFGLYGEVEVRMIPRGTDLDISKGGPSQGLQGILRAVRGRQ
jgi:hypothetical protein